MAPSARAPPPTAAPWTSGTGSVAATQTRSARPPQSPGGSCQVPSRRRGASALPTRSHAARPRPETRAAPPKGRRLP
eukprot:6862688-Prymnesium_polylepis.1